MDPTCACLASREGVALAFTLVASLTKTMVPSGTGSVCRKRLRASTSLLGGAMYRPWRRDRGSSMPALFGPYSTQEREIGRKSKGVRWAKVDSLIDSTRLLICLGVWCVVLTLLPAVALIMSYPPFIISEASAVTPGLHPVAEAKTDCDRRGMAPKSIRTSPKYEASSNRSTSSNTTLLTKRRGGSGGGKEGEGDGGRVLHGCGADLGLPLVQHQLRHTTRRAYTTHQTVRKRQGQAS